METELENQDRYELRTFSGYPIRDSGSWGEQHRNWHIYDVTTRKTVYWFPTHIMHSVADNRELKRAEEKVRTMNENYRASLTESRSVPET